MGMVPGHLAASENLFCPLSWTADLELEVADANPQTLISFPWGGYWQKYGMVKVAGFVYLREKI